MSDPLEDMLKPSLQLAYVHVSLYLPVQLPLRVPLRKVIAGQVMAGM